MRPDQPVEPMVANEGWVGEPLSRPIAARGGGRRPAFTVAARPAKLASRVDRAGGRNYPACDWRSTRYQRAERWIFAKFDRRRFGTSNLCCCVCRWRFMQDVPVWLL